MKLRRKVGAVHDRAVLPDARVTAVWFLIFASAATALTVAPATRAQDSPGSVARPPSTRFEIASVKPAGDCEGRGDGPRLGIRASPGHLTVTCQTVEFLVRQAYLANGRDPLFVPPQRYNQPLKGAPSWVSSEGFTIDAKSDVPSSRETMLGSMLRSLLEERFKLKIHRETREVNIYELGVVKTGPKLAPAADQSCRPFDPDRTDPPRGTHLCGVLVRSIRPSVPSMLYGATMDDFSRALSRLLDREVVNKTGIEGKFDFTLELSAADLFPIARRLINDSDSPDQEPGGSSIFAAIRKLGLTLTSAKTPGEFLVIDSAERPSEN